MPKGSTPWSTRTIAEGGTDSPVSDLVPVPDSAQPVINAGFIDDSGKWRLAAAADDRAFTFQDPEQALAAGASIFIDVNMLQHDIMIFGVLDSSGNDINADFLWRNPATPMGPYAASTFTDTGINGGKTWLANKRTDGTLADMMNDTSEALASTWQFYKFQSMRGTVGSIEVRSNEAADAGTVSTAYLRLV